jgi:hypothetical protein
MGEPEGVDEEGEPASWQRFWDLLPENPGSARIRRGGEVEHRRG